MRKHKARITLIAEDKFKRDCQIKALKQGTNLSEVTIKLLTKWLEGK